MVPCNSVRLRARQTAMCALIALGCCCAGWLGAAEAAPITWANRGAFEACLENRLNAWLQAQAELVVNEDPAAGRLDDAEVWRWMLETSAACRQAGGANPEAENRFTNHMARWRQHIYDLASSIKQKGASD